MSGPVVGTRDRAAAAAVVDQGVHGLLEHPLLVAHDDIGGAQLQQPLEAVVAVDHAAVQVVEVGGGEAAAVQLHHGADIGRDDRHHVEDHPLGAVAGQAEGLHHLETLEQAGPLLAGGGFQLLLQAAGQGLQVDFLEQLFDILGAHAGVEFILVFLPHVAVVLVAQDLQLGQGGAAGIHDDIGGEVEHLLQQPGGDIQNQPHPGGDALEIPDMGDGGGQLDVAHPLPADLGAGHLDAAAVADLALVADALVLTAVAFPVLRRPENALAEQAVPLGLQGAVIDGLRLFHLAVGPARVSAREKPDQF